MYRALKVTTTYKNKKIYFELKYLYQDDRKIPSMIVENSRGIESHIKLFLEVNNWTELHRVIDNDNEIILFCKENGDREIK